ncbi:MAG TPA: PASTA domain-containing protein, partial [Terriglobia bacterium]|nr:PASTA domain-containing protein [Terriglobia bacterium]
LFLLFTVLVAVALISAITTIRLTIQGHQETMPNLVGRPAEAAERVLNALGLELKIEGRMFNPKYAADQIVSQVPPPGTRVKVGQHVHVLVSLGQPRVTIPNVVGWSARAAQIAAIQNGLSVGDLVAVYAPGSAVDQVVAQDPAASAAQIHSPAVNLLVSLGDPAPAYECPSFVGRPLSEAQLILQQSGLKAGSVKPVPREGTPVNTILSQTPEAGGKISPDADVTFEVAGPPLNPGPATLPLAPLTSPPGASSPPGPPPKPQ